MHMKETYQELYAYMAQSRDPKNMKAFGKVMTEMMEWMIANKPSEAEAWIEKLEAIKWKNYLTRKEAEQAVNDMTPRAAWTFEAWRTAMEGMGLPVEESPCYNAWALWTVMNMIYSDSAKTIAGIMEMPLAEIPAKQMVTAVHALAMDKLKDEDGRFHVRRYFGLE